MILEAEVGVFQTIKRIIENHDKNIWFKSVRLQKGPMAHFTVSIDNNSLLNEKAEIK
jgi:hypothetical protein